MKRYLLLATLLTGPAFAADEVPPPPPMLEGDSATEELEPQITIRREEERVVEEYRMNGQLYMIKVTPKNAEPYYLVDADGDGQLEHRMDELDPKIMIPSWTIFRW